MSLPWDRIHTHMTALDAARTPEVGLVMRQIGYDGIHDALGGTYNPRHYEKRELAGVVALTRALETITKAAWDVIFGARHRPLSIAQREARVAVATMLAARPVYDVLLDVGVVDVLPTETILAGVAGETLPWGLHATGLWWLAGCPTERRIVTEDEAEDFVAGAPIRAVLGIGTWKPVEWSVTYVPGGTSLGDGLVTSSSSRIVRVATKDAEIARVYPEGGGEYSEDRRKVLWSASMLPTPESDQAFEAWVRRHLANEVEVLRHEGS